MWTRSCRVKASHMVYGHATTYNQATLSMMHSVGLQIQVDNSISNLKCLGVKTYRVYPPVDLYIQLSWLSSEDQFTTDVSKMLIASHICTYSSEWTHGENNMVYYIHKGTGIKHMGVD